MLEVYYGKANAASQARSRRANLFRHLQGNLRIMAMSGAVSGAPLSSLRPPRTEMS